MGGDEPKACTAPVTLSSDEAAVWVWQTLHRSRLDILEVALLQDAGAEAAAPESTPSIKYWLFTAKDGRVMRKNAHNATLTKLKQRLLDQALKRGLSSTDGQFATLVKHGHEAEPLDDNRWGMLARGAGEGGQPNKSPSRIKTVGSQDAEAEDEEEDEQISYAVVASLGCSSLLKQHHVTYRRGSGGEMGDAITVNRVVPRDLTHGKEVKDKDRESGKMKEGLLPSKVAAVNASVASLLRRLVRWLEDVRGVKISSLSALVAVELEQGSGAGPPRAWLERALEVTALPKKNVWPRKDSQSSSCGEASARSSASSKPLSAASANFSASALESDSQSQLARLSRIPAGGGMGRAAPPRPCVGDFCGHCHERSRVEVEEGGDWAGVEMSADGSKGMLLQVGATRAAEDDGERFFMAFKSIAAARQDVRAGADWFWGSKLLDWFSEHQGVLGDEDLASTNPASYYRVVPVCGNCYHVYKRLDARRAEVLQARQMTGSTFRDEGQPMGQIDQVEQSGLRLSLQKRLSMGSMPSRQEQVALTHRLSRPKPGGSLRPALRKSKSQGDSPSGYNNLSPKVAGNPIVHGSTAEKALKEKPAAPPAVWNPPVWQSIQDSTYAERTEKRSSAFVRKLGKPQPHPQLKPLEPFESFEPFEPLEPMPVLASPPPMGHLTLKDGPSITRAKRKRQRQPPGAPARNRSASRLLHPWQRDLEQKREELAKERSHVKVQKKAKPKRASHQEDRTPGAAASDNFSNARARLKESHTWAKRTLAATSKRLARCGVFRQGSGSVLGVGAGSGDRRVTLAVTEAQEQLKAFEGAAQLGAGVGGNAGRLTLASCESHCAAFEGKFYAQLQLITKHAQEAMRKGSPDETETTVNVKSKAKGKAKGRKDRKGQGSASPTKQEQQQQQETFFEQQPHPARVDTMRPDLCRACGNLPATRRCLDCMGSLGEQRDYCSCCFVQHHRSEDRQGHRFLRVMAEVRSGEASSQQGRQMMEAERGVPRCSSCHDIAASRHCRQCNTNTCAACHYHNHKESDGSHCYDVIGHASLALQEALCRSSGANYLGGAVERMHGVNAPALTHPTQGQSLTSQMSERPMVDARPGPTPPLASHKENDGEEEWESGSGSDSESSEEGLLWEVNPHRVDLALVLEEEENEAVKSVHKHEQARHLIKAEQGLELPAADVEGLSSVEVMHCSLK